MPPKKVWKLATFKKSDDVSEDQSVNEQQAEAYNPFKGGM